LARRRLALTVLRSAPDAPSWATPILQEPVEGENAVNETEFVPTASAVLQTNYDVDSLLLTESGHPIATEGGNRLSLYD